MSVENPQGVQEQKEENQGGGGGDWSGTVVKKQTGQEGMKGAGRRSVRRAGCT